MAEPARLADGVVHQRRADAGVLQRRIDGERPEQEGRVRACRHVP